MTNMTVMLGFQLHAMLSIPYTDVSCN